MTQSISELVRLQALPPQSTMQLHFFIAPLLLVKNTFSDALRFLGETIHYFHVSETKYWCFVSSSCLFIFLIHILITFYCAVSIKLCEPEKDKTSRLMGMIV